MANIETIRTAYFGNLRTEIEHVQSGNKMITDAPVDNQGKGEYFSPTDMLSAAFTSCILTIMGIKAEASGFSIEGATAKTWKTMSANPRMVSEIRVEFDLSACNLSRKHQMILERLTKISPVPLSIHSDIIQNVTLKF